MLFFLLLSLLVSDKLSVKKISIDGNKLTKSYTIQREILFSVGDSVSVSEIELSRKRIENTRLFTSVSYLLKKDSNAIEIVYNVFEKFPLLISPVISTSGLSTDDVTYGVKIQHINVAGKRHLIDFTALGGDRSIYSFYYHNPWIKGTNRYSYTFFANQSKGSNRLISSETEKNINVGISFGKGFGPYFSSSVSINYNNKLFSSENFDVVSINGTDENNILEYAMGVSYDTRDFYNFPMSGKSASFSFTYYDIMNESENSSTRLNISFENYSKLTSQLILASSMVTENRFGDPFYYHKIYFNSKNVVRGFQFNRSFGENAYVIKTELRYQFLKDFFWSLDIPYAKKYLTNLRTMMYVYSFYDIGAVEDSYSALVNKRPERTIGGGIGLILPYMKAMRFEFSRNETSVNTWSLEMDLPF